MNLTSSIVTSNDIGVSPQNIKSQDPKLYTSFKKNAAVLDKVPKEFHDQIK